jgi:aspartate aminotransferase
LNPNVRGLSPSPALSMNELTRELVREGREVFKLGFGQSPFPVPEPVVAALRENAHQKDYLPVRGLAALREAVAEYHRRRQGITRTGALVLIGPGSKELMFLLQLVYHGDLLIPLPAWVSYAPQAEILGRPVCRIPTRRENDWKLPPDELERICASHADRPRLLLLNTPHNPTGHSYSREELTAIADVARRHRLVVLSDEIYAELHHRGEHVSIAELYPEGTIVSTGLSKWCGAGGWRLGTFTFPDSLGWLLDSMAVAASETYSSASAPIQYAAVRAFALGAEIEDYLLHCRRILRALGPRAASTLRDSGLHVANPEGAFYLFPDFAAFREELRARGIETGSALSERLLKETGVASLSGAACEQPDSELTLRLAYVDFDGQRVLAASRALGLDRQIGESFLEENCPNVLTAAARIDEWLASGAST